MYNFSFVPRTKSFVSQTGHKNPLNLKVSQWLKAAQKQEWRENSATAHLKLYSYYIPPQKETQKHYNCL